MSASWMERLLVRLKVERHDIGRLGAGTYLTRWILAGRRDPATGQRRHGDGWKLFLHVFHRGDAEPYFHDHGWPFWSLILWGGYWEITPTGRKWYGPGRLLRRPAEWKHRVEVPEGKRCWSLLWIGTKVRSWGFWCPMTGFLPWRQHEASRAAGKPGCGE
jgi:hypothetical protein